jgi:Domain of unknown function (DUF4399)
MLCCQIDSQVADTIARSQRATFLDEALIVFYLLRKRKRGIKMPTMNVRPRQSMRELLIACFMVATCTSTAFAASLPENEAERTCWLSYSRERTAANLRELTSVDFSNLRDGYTVSSPFLVDFSVRGMGVTPAGKAVKGTGHHHILINAPLPTIVTEKIPFSDTHKHYGKGQTNAVLDLPPGRHTLRLLFADHDHRPYFVYSPEIAINVTGPRSKMPRPRIDRANFQASCAAWYQDEVSRPRSSDEPLHFSNIRSKETVLSPFNIRLGVNGFGVIAKGQTAEKTGYFMLSALKRNTRQVVESFDLSNGATQKNISLPPDAYTFRLRFVDPVRGEDLLPPHELDVTVTSSQR